MEVYFREVREDLVRVLTIELTEFESKEVEVMIIGTFDFVTPPEACKVVHDPPYSIILPPLKQLNSVDNIHEVICRDENHHLIFKRKTGNPACVRESTRQKLIKRGWVSDYGPQHIDIMKNEQKD